MAHTRTQFGPTIAGAGVGAVSPKGALFQGLARRGGRRLRWWAAVAVLLGAACGSVNEASPDGGGAGPGGGGAGPDGGGAGPDGGGAGPDGGSSDGDDAGGSPAFSLSVPADPIDVRLAESAAVDVTVERMNALDGDITMEVGGVPAGVSADSITIPAGESSGARRHRRRLVDRGAR